MKGIMFNLLEEVVTGRFGDDLWDEFLGRADVTGAYTSLGNYPEAEIAALISAASELTGQSRSEFLRWFGASSMPHLRTRYPALFEGHRSSRSFVRSINAIIHPEVRKLYVGAACPFFHVGETPEGHLTMRYQSSRNLCDLAHGFTLGAARLWCEDVEIIHTSCMNHGAEDCEMSIQWVQ